MPGLDAVATTLQSLVDRGLLVGFVIGVDEGGGARVRSGGARSIDGAAMGEETQFAIASCTKPIAGALALRLVELGLLGLDEPISRHLPEFGEPRVIRRVDGPLAETVAAERPITLRHLLTMTPGFGWVAEEGPLATAMGEQQVSPGPFPPQLAPDEYVRRVAALPLASQPGQRWRYHLSSDVLGVLIHRSTGRPVSELLREHVTGPLGMAGTGFVGQSDRLATAYGPADGDALEPLEVPAGVFTDPPEFESLAAGLVSTVPDQLRFYVALLAEGGPVLSPGSVAAMSSNQLTAHQRAGADGFLEPGCGYGFHLEVRRDGAVGWAGGLGTIAYANPNTGRAAALFTQQSIETPATRQAFDAFWQLLA